MKMNRRRSRILVMQALYAWEISKMDIDELLTFSWVDPKKMEGIEQSDFVFPQVLIAGTIENIEQIDKIISENLHNWELSRLDLVDKAVLRFSTYSLIFQKDVPPSIVIDEAISIVKDYGNEDSFKFINAVLDNIKNREYNP